MQDIKNKILLVAIALMVVVITLAASYTPVNWTYFSLLSIVLALLIWLQKRELKKTLTESSNNGLSLKGFKESLDIVAGDLDDISKKEIDETYLSNLLSIMDNKMPNIDEYKISIINQFGIANYTQISIPFAKGERLINRGVSAAIDGFVEESQKNIADSIELLKLSITEIKNVLDNI